MLWFLESESESELFIYAYKIFNNIMLNNKYNSGQRSPKKTQGVAIIGPQAECHRGTLPRLTRPAQSDKFQFKRMCK